MISNKSKLELRLLTRINVNRKSVAKSVKNRVQLYAWESCVLKSPTMTKMQPFMNRCAMAAVFVLRNVRLKRFKLSICHPTWKRIRYTGMHFFVNFFLAYLFFVLFWCYFSIFPFVLICCSFSIFLFVLIFEHLHFFTLLYFLYKLFFVILNYIEFAVFNFPDVLYC